MHSHSHDLGATAPAPRSTRLVLGLAMGVLGLLTLIGLALLWPTADETVAKRPYLAEGVTLTPGVVVALEPDAGSGGQIRLRLDDGGQEVVLQANPEVFFSDIQLGDHVRAVRLPPVAGSDQATYAFMDFYRGWPLLGLAALMVVVVVAVARLKGLAAIAGLAGGMALVWFFLLPALTAGKNPLLVVLTTAAAALFIIVYLAHGVSVKTTTALLGTFAGTAVVATLAWWAIPAVRLTPMAHDDLMALAYAVPGLDLKGILLSGMVLAGIGVLNDVTITQAAAVWELRAAAPTATRRAVFARAMRIGRDHIASTVYTIAFAYVGSALGLLALASTLDHTVMDLLTFEEIASELVAILVASVGLVSAIPLTTAIGAWLAGGPIAPAPATTMASATTTASAPAPATTTTTASAPAITSAPATAPPSD
ncbi:MAG: YibE/F family protein [Propionibacteriaceae bacterium]|jgi:uncharacterized membrane protein|nr:YibE/F family protein [Propionibacteriaceae bacterium]